MNSLLSGPLLTGGALCVQFKGLNFDQKLISLPVTFQGDEVKGLKGTGQPHNNTSASLHESTYSARQQQ